MAIISGSSAEGGKPWGEGNARPPGGEHQIPAGDVIPTLRRLDAALKGWERSEGDGGGREESPDPEPSRAGLFGGHHVRKWLPAKHRRPQARGAMPGLVRRNACEMLVMHLERPPFGGSGARL